MSRFFKQHYPVAYLLRVLVITGLLPTVLGFGIYVVTDYWHGRQRLLEDNRERAQIVGQTIDSHLLRAQALARTFAGTDEILTGDLKTFSQRAARSIRASSLGNHVLVHRLQSGQVFRYSVANEQFYIAQEDTAAPREVLAHGISVISDVLTDTDSGKQYVNVHVPVNVDGKTIYSIAIAIPTQQLTEVLLEQGLPDGWLASLIDRQGIIAGRSRNSETFVGQPASADLRSAIRLSPAGTLDTITKDGVENMTAFSRSSRTGYTTIIGVPRAETTGPLKHKLILLVSVFILLMILGLLLAQIMARLISSSVHALIHPAIDLGKGRPSTVERVYVTEAYEVATALGQAADLLAQRDAVLLAQQEELQRFYFFGEKANELLLLLDQEGNIRYANQMASRRLGYSNEELMTIKMIQIDHQATSTALTEMFKICRSTPIPAFERDYQCKDRSRFPVEITATVLEYRGEWLMHIAPRDISERVQSEKSLRWAASHDALTGLSNRSFALQFLSEVLDRKHAIESGALLYIDLDRFKPVNDLYSHEIGDRVLIEVARRLQTLMRHGDILARFGGDEFVAILLNHHPERQDVVATLQALIAAVSAPINIGNIQVRISASIGVSYFPAHGNSPDALIHASDLAMLQAKKSGANTYVFYTPELDERTRFVADVERRLRQALHLGNFSVSFQPIIHLASGSVDGVEALVRLDDGIDPPLGPSSFIPVAEMCGLIAPLDQWTALESCRQQCSWRAAGINLNVSINVSALQFQRANFINQMQDLIEVTGIAPEYLVVELTETAVMEDLTAAANILTQLRTMGIRIALDDFGTGYSSLSTLSMLPIDKIKIDQSFIRRIGTDPASCAIVDTIIALAKTLELELVAEGVETEAALRYLRERGCDLGQGFYFSGPLGKQALMQWYHDWKGISAQYPGHARVQPVK
jgi:diguanylate cyclase (GGDEF)-like protein/PAS domain S-box-containing protein